MSSPESLLGLLDSILRSVERLCKCELYSLGHTRKISALCSLYKIYHRVDHPMNEYLYHFIAAHNTRVSAVLGEVISFGYSALQNCSIQSVVSACCCASVKLAAIGRVWWWHLELF